MPLTCCLIMMKFNIGVLKGHQRKKSNFQGDSQSDIKGHSSDGSVCQVAAVEFYLVPGKLP